MTILLRKRRGNVGQSILHGITGGLRGHIDLSCYGWLVYYSLWLTSAPGIPYLWDVIVFSSKLLEPLSLLFLVLLSLLELTGLLTACELSLCAFVTTSFLSPYFMEWLYPCYIWGVIQADCIHLCIPAMCVLLPCPQPYLSQCAISCIYMVFSVILVKISYFCTFSWIKITLFTILFDCVLNM